jgi:hypothetical protein
MRSEIPQLEVVTAIADADFEDFVAQLLFSQGWSIIYRAFDSSALNEFLVGRSGQRTVIIYKADLPGLMSQSLMEYEADPFTFISLDGSEPAAHAVMQKIRSQLRLPLVQNHDPMKNRVAEYQRPAALPRLFTVIGSSGAPGRTSLTVALGEELFALRGKAIGIIDADFKSSALSRRLSKSPSNKGLSLLPLDSKDRPTSLPELTPDETAIVDLGTLPALGEAVHDRRWHGSLISSILDATTQLLYVVRSTDESLDELALFLKEFPILLRKIPVTYICVLVGNSRELRAAEARFLSLTTAENRFMLRESQLTGAPGLLSMLGSPKPGKSEIGKIAQSLVTSGK